MKTQPIILMALFSAASLLAAEKPVANKLAMRDALRHEDLAPRFAKEQEKSIKARELTPVAVSTEKPKPYKPTNLLDRSEFLSCNGLSTLVPKGSILHVPDNCQGRMKIDPGSKIVPWAEFFRLNRGWVTTMEVSRKQAEADEPLDEKALERISKNPRVVVATLSGGPITVLQKKEPEADPAAAATGQAPVDPNNNSTKTNK